MKQAGYTLGCEEKQVVHKYCEKFCFVFKARGGRIAGYLTNEQRSHAGWIGASKCEVIFERALSFRCDRIQNRQTVHQICLDFLYKNCKLKFYTILYFGRFGRLQIAFFSVSNEHQEQGAKVRNSRLLQA